MPETAAFQEWLASGISNQAIVETVEIRHPGFPTAWLARWNEDFAVTLEDGKAQTFQASDFAIQGATVEASTLQTARAVISSLQGRLYELLLALDGPQRAIPIEVVHRLFFHDSPVAPLIAPPPIWHVYSISASVDSLSAELQAVQLRERAIGKYYTLKDFPVLYYA